MIRRLIEMHPSENSRCTWCGADVDPSDGYRAGEQPGERRATFCRLEHVIPWAIQGAHWEAGEIESPGEVAECAHCGEPLGDVRVLLVRRRGEHRIPDGFCSVDHMVEWAKSGGRWRQA
jgi:hypothetical protein